MCSLPLPGLSPTVISAPEPGPASGGGRRQATLQKLIAGGRQLIHSGHTCLSVEQLASAAEVSVVTVRAHWQALADALALEPATETFSTAGDRSYERAILRVPSSQTSAAGCGKSIDQANNKDLITTLICAHAASGCTELAIEVLVSEAVLPVVMWPSQQLVGDGYAAANEAVISLIGLREAHDPSVELLAPERVRSADALDHTLAQLSAGVASLPPPAAQRDAGSAGGGQASALPVAPAYVAWASRFYRAEAHNDGARRVDHADCAALDKLPSAPPGGAEQTPHPSSCIARQDSPIVMDDAGSGLRVSRAAARASLPQPRAIRDSHGRSASSQPP